MILWRRTWSLGVQGPKGLERFGPPWRFPLGLQWCQELRLLMRGGSAATGSGTAVSEQGKTSSSSNSSQQGSSSSQQGSSVSGDSTAQSQSGKSDGQSQQETSDTASKSDETTTTKKSDADQTTEQKTGASQTTEQKAAASSSDKGTYEEAGLHAVTITYVDANGNQIAPAYREALADGESYSVASPTVGGYELADVSQATVSGTVSKGSGDVSVSVRYNSTLATYTVVHERQVSPGSGDYTVAESETLTAPSGTTVTAVAKRYENYKCVTGSDGLTAKVTPDGKTTIVIRYDIVEPSYGIYFSTGSTYVAPLTGKEGDAVVAPADPTRAGYAFAGWDTDGDGKANTLPTTFPGHDVMATALWEPAETTYQVNYWVEDEGSSTSYHLLKTETKTGMTESETSAADRLDTSKSGDYKWYVYAREDSPQTVKGDGTTVVNVFYDWKRVNFYFKVRVGSTDYDIPGHTGHVSAKMRERFAVPSQSEVEAAYRAHGGGATSFYGWEFSTNSTTYSSSRIYAMCANLDYSNASWLDDESLELGYIARYVNDRLYTHYSMELQEDANGSTYSEIQPSSATSTGSIGFYRAPQQKQGFWLMAYRTSKNVWDGSDASKIEWNEWVDVSTAAPDSNGEVAAAHQDFLQSNVIEFKYDRLSYPVTYYSNGEAVSTKTQLFGTTVDVSASIVPAAPEGMEFAGWYADPDFTGSPVTSLTMPVGGTNLYAKWIHPAVNVTFDSTGGSAVDAQKVAWGDKATRPTDPTRAGYKFGGWFYLGAGSDTPAPFQFDLGLEGDAHLVAAWESTKTPTTYTVRHKTAGGKVLYEETHEGTVGQTVTALALANGAAQRQGYAYVNASGKTIDLAEDSSQNVIEFTYSNDASNKFVVHLWDEETGLPVAMDVDFDSLDALLNYAAPTLSGYHVLNGGQGYLSTRDGGQELTFWYEKDSQPVTPDKPTNPDEPTKSDKPTNPSKPTKPTNPLNPDNAAKSQTTKSAKDTFDASATVKESATKASTAKTAYVPRHMAQLPSTGDSTSPVAPLAAGAFGAALAALGLKLRHRRDA